MSTLLSQLPVAIAASPTDEVALNQTVSGVRSTRRATLSLIQPGFALVINTQAGTSYTLALTDAVNTLVEMNNASAMTLTVPPNSSVAFPIGTNLLVSRLGAGSMTFSPGSGVTILTPSTLTLRVQNSVGCLIKRATNTWYLCGDLT